MAREQEKAETQYKEQLKKKDELAKMKKEAREEEKKIAKLHHQLHKVKEQQKVEECQKCKTDTMKESYGRVKAVEEEKQKQYDEYTKQTQEFIKKAIGGDDVDVTHITSPFLADTGSKTESKAAAAAAGTGAENQQDIDRQVNEAKAWIAGRHLVFEKAMEKPSKLGKQAEKEQARKLKEKEAHKKKLDASKKAKADKAAKEKADLQAFKNSAK